MNKISKKIIIPLIILLLLSIAVFSVAKTKISNSLINKTDVKEDLELDNWEISTVFYDSIVNNGNTPLTEINWVEPTDNKDGQTRIITVQINYKNTNVSENYGAGMLSITIPNILSHYRDANWNINNGWSDK